MSDARDVLVAVIADYEPDYAEHAAEKALAALRSAGFQVFKPEDCETQHVDELDHEAGPQWMWPTPFAPVPAGTYFLVPADSGGSG